MENITFREATIKDIDTLYDLILGLATYEKRPQDMTATKDELKYWLYEKNIATALLLELNNKAIGYAIYYPVFGSFSATGKVHLEDIFILEEHRGKGLGKYFLAKVIDHVLTAGYSGMEWSCLDWNEPSIAFYNNIGAEKESGRVYFDFNNSQMQAFLKSQNH